MGKPNALCPRCDSVLIRRLPSESRFERLLALFSISPFRCHRCEYRFRLRHRGLRDFSNAESQRQTYRIPVRLPVSFESGEVSGEGLITDISAGGCALDSRRNLRPGLILKLHLPPGNDAASSGSMEQIATVRAASGSRAGLQFMVFTPEERHCLTETITATVKRHRTS